MVEIPFETGGTRRSVWVLILSAGLFFIFVPVFLVFLTDGGSEAAVSFMNFGFSYLDLLAFLGVPVGVSILVFGEKKVRDRYVFEEEGIREFSTFMKPRMFVRYEDIEGVWWSRDRFNSEAGSFEVFVDTGKQPELVMYHIRDFDAVKELLEDNVEDLERVEKAPVVGGFAND